MQGKVGLKSERGQGGALEEVKGGSTKHTSRSDTAVCSLGAQFTRRTNASRTASAGKLEGNNTLLALVAQLSEFWYNFARMKMYASETVINDGTSREIMKGACPPESLPVTLGGGMAIENGSPLPVSFG
ncbi:MAG: hypothetical protein FRX49_05864 [Trebouxia sp. A1-2]|nr:MAG: hypothetical protein FRX49_05864 [Trebouxia sp. A1-2]